MEIVLLTALGVGGATVLGSLIGFLFKNLSHKVSDFITAFASGVMLCAAILGLIGPSIEYGKDWGVLISLLVCVAGIFIGALSLTLVDKLVPHLHKLVGPKDIEEHKKTKLSKVLLFVIAIAIHNLPEGIAAGVGFGSDNVNRAIIIALGIALQNIPEGIVIIGPMLSAGVSKGKTFVCALITGLIEVIGTLIGYFAVYVAQIILPFALAFAGGAMLYVISDEMIPETHHEGSQKSSTYALLIGFCIMLVLDVLLG